jgi:hypothetical protein
MISPFSRPGNRTEEEQQFNAAMGAVRIEVEHGFGIVANTWPALNAHWKMHISSSIIGTQYRTAIILTNAINCLRYSQVSRFFNCQPPELHEYFHH